MYCGEPDFAMVTSSCLNIALLGALLGREDLCGRMIILAFTVTAAVKLEKYFEFNFSNAS
jgi:hypothetical protein